MKKYEIIDNQIERLKIKGLKFKDENQAKKIMLRENHYYITEGYEDIFIDLKQSTNKQEKYEEETYFEELYAIYQFDRDLKNLIFDYINIIENNIKSYISYEFSDIYGNKDFLKRENFKLEKQYNPEFETLKEQISSNLERNFKSPNSDLKKFMDQNHFLPLWMLVKAFTFGNIVNFYCLMKKEDQQEVAQHFKISPYSLDDYLKILNIIRNICAHGDILFNIRLNIHLKERDCNYHQALGISKNKNGSYKFGVNDFFAIIILLKKLLSSTDFEEMFLKMENSLNKVKQEIDSLSYENLLKIMGFPKNYEKLKDF